ncbi:MAG: Gfo/Idh/MocA family oxidoreductase [Cryomorphaceae bacterium]|nr:Gfo/Idh/MocA family oxidoreductase [Cryomorphaceae bacterium]
MLKIGLVGAGHLGKIHAKCIELVQGVKLEGIFDTDQETTKLVSEQHGVKAFGSLEDLIQSVDVVDIVTPTLSHYDVAVKCIRAGKHIFIEKPITETSEQARKLIKLAEEAKIKAHVGHVERFNPAFVQAQTYISSPLFIETHRLAEFNPRGTDVPVVLDLMIHDIDIVLHLVKSPVKKISASGVSVISDTPDITNARIEFDNGCVANLTASRISMKNMRKTRIFQRDAYITVDFLKKKSEIIRIEHLDEHAPVDDMALLLETGKGEKKRIFFENPIIPESNAIRDELQSLVDAINKNTSTVVTLEDGSNALRVAEDILSQIQHSSIL